jgi:uncharacterized protein YjhX (UPF0386 family)
MKIRIAFLLLFIVVLFSCNSTLQFTATLTQVDHERTSGHYLFSGHDVWHLTFDNGKVIEVYVLPKNGRYEPGIQYTVFKDWTNTYFTKSEVNP